MKYPSISSLSVLFLIVGVLLFHVIRKKDKDYAKVIDVDSESSSIKSLLPTLLLHPHRDKIESIYGILDYIFHPSIHNPPRGLVLLSHGCGHEPETWYDFVDNLLNMCRP